MRESTIDGPASSAPEQARSTDTPAKRSVANTLRSRPDKLELISLAIVASALLGFVVLVTALVIPRPVVAPLIGMALVGIFGARLWSTTGSHSPHTTNADQR